MVAELREREGKMSQKKKLGGRRGSDGRPGKPVARRAEGLDSGKKKKRKRGETEKLLVTTR